MQRVIYAWIEWNINLYITLCLSEFIITIIVFPSENYDVKLKSILFILGWTLLLTFSSEDFYFSFWFKINKVKYMTTDNIWYLAIGTPAANKCIWKSILTHGQRHKIIRGGIM